MAMREFSRTRCARGGAALAIIVGGLGSLGARGASAAPALQSQLLVDLNPTPGAPPTSQPTDLITFGGGLLFLADDGTHGRELWTSDGTASGTRLVHDIAPGPATASPTGLAASGDRAYLRAWDDCAGAEPWVTDGTDAGTLRVADIRPGPASSQPSGFTPCAGGTIFAANDGVHGVELWRTDGTEAGTTLIADLVDGPAGGWPHDFTPVVDGVVFVAWDATSRVELWRTDGTAAGTTRLLAAPALGAGWPTVRAFGDRAILVIDAEILGGDILGGDIWTSDGSSAGTRRIYDAAPAEGGWARPMLVGPMGSSYLFTVMQAQQRQWSTDGSVVGTRPLFTDAERLAVSFSQVHELDIGRHVLVGSVGASEGFWESDGTALGTRRITDIPGGSSWPTCWTVGGRLVIFTGSDTLWVLEDDTVGTLRSGFVPAATTPLAARLGGELAFVGPADAAVGIEPWLTDGTPGGTRLLADVNPLPSTDGSNPRSFVVVGDRAFFVTTFAAVGRELAVTDGLPGGTQVIDLPGGSLGLWPGPLTPFGAGVIFAGGVGQPQPWISDGTLAGTRLIVDIPDRGYLSDDAEFTVYRGEAYFQATDSVHGAELWATDGSAAGTRLVADINPGTPSSRPRQLTVVGDELYFAAIDAMTGDELWVTDGTTAGTRQVIDMRPGTNSGFPLGLAELNGELFVFLQDDVVGHEPRLTDGTAAGTRLIKDCNPGADGVIPMDFEVVGGLYYFSTWVGPTEDVWVSDGTPDGTHRVTAFGPTSGTMIRHITPLGSDCAFLVKVGGSHSLWRSDGTPGGAYRFFDESLPDTALSSIDGRLLFMRGTAIGTRLWVSDGMADGTVPLDDAATTAMNSPDDAIVALGDRVIFAGDHLMTGSEPRTLPRAILTDRDLDGVGDESDPCPDAPGADPADFDGDGHADGCDRCVAAADPAQLDSDCDDVVNACEFVWGDVSPVGGGDGDVDVGDVVRLLRMSVGIETPLPDELLRGSLAPWVSVTPGSPPSVPPVIEPVLAQSPRSIDVGDVVLALRATVGLVRFAPPR